MMRMSFSEWVERYRPITNPYDIAASWDSLMFDTYGEQLLAVRRRLGRGVIWTLVEGDDDMWIINGYHFVNRLGYFVTEVPCLEEHIEVDT